jgi:hypothetical protein
MKSATAADSRDTAEREFPCRPSGRTRTATRDCDGRITAKWQFD